MPVWLWSDTTDANRVGPISASASERGYTVSISAKVKHIEWNLGDGSAVIRCGIGQRFDPRTMTPETPVACGRQEGYQRQGTYTITATSHWEVHWQGIGQSGVIDFPRETKAQVKIGEIQVVTTGGS